METWAARSMGTPRLQAELGLADTWRDLPGWDTGGGRHVGSVLRRPLTRGRPAELLGRVSGAGQGLSTALKIALEPGSQENTGFGRDSWLWQMQGVSRQPQCPEPGGTNPPIPKPQAGPWAKVDVHRLQGSSLGGGDVCVCVCVPHCHHLLRTGSYCHVTPTTTSALAPPSTPETLIFHSGSSSC